MAMKTNMILKSQSGVVLVIALIMMTVLTVIGIASMSSSIFEIKLSGNKRGATDAFYIADAAVQSVSASIGNFAITDRYKYKDIDKGKLPVELKDEPIDKAYSAPSFPLPSGVTFKVNPNVIIYHMTPKNAPRGAGFSAINFGFENFLIDSAGKDQMGVDSIGSTCEIREKLVSIVPTSQGGYE